MESSFAASYLASEDANWWFLGRRDMVRRLLAAHGVREDASLLDIGCSGGALLADLAAHGWTRTVGADASPEAVARCQARGRQAVVADAARLPFADATFDVVIASDILEHVDDARAALEEWRRVLKPDGIALVFVPAFGFLWSAHDEANQHFRRYRRSELRAALAQAGFRVARASYWNVALFPATVAVQWVSRLLRLHPQAPSIGVPAAPVNGILAGLLRLENAFLLRRNALFGVSVFAIARPPASSLSQTPEAFHRWNEDMAMKYNPDAYHESANAVVRWIEGTRVRRILSFLETRLEHRVLEVGVGAGNILAQVPVRDRAGIDLSPSLLGLARQRLPEATLVEGNAEAFPPELRAQRFDRVFCSEVLEHVQHPDLVVREMASVLAPEGVAVISVPNERFINALKAFLLRLRIFSWLFPRLSLKMDDEWHLHVFDRALLRKTVEERFIVERIEAVPFAWFPVRLVARLKPRHRPS